MPFRNSVIKIRTLRLFFVSLCIHQASLQPPIKLSHALLNFVFQHIGIFCRPFTIITTNFFKKSRTFHSTLHEVVLYQTSLFSSRHSSHGLRSLPPKALRSSGAKYSIRQFGRLFDPSLFLHGTRKTTSYPLNCVKLA